MSDPFSAAASAIGVISLGIQVTQQLITFCQAYQSYDEDIKRIEAKASSLRRPLHALREIIQDAQSSNPELADDLAEKALGLQRMVNRLKVAMEGNMPGPPLAERLVSERLRGHLKRVVYPFRRDALKDMWGDLEGIQNALQMTLSLHSTHKMMRLGSIQQTILDEVQQIRITLQDYPRGMPPPSLLRSWCENQSQSQRSCDAMSLTQRESNTYAESITETYADDDADTYEGYETETQVTDESVTNRSVVTRSYASSGRGVYPSKFKARHRVETTERSFKFLSGLLRVAITASFSLSKGAGGYSIAPSLSVQAVIKYDGSALQTLYAKLNNMTKYTFEETVDDCIYEVRQTFSRGKARPTDVFYLDYWNPDYSTISFVDCLVQFDLPISRSHFPALERLTRSLVDMGSIPQNNFHQGALRDLFRAQQFRQEQYRLASYLVDHGGPCALSNGLLNHVERYNVKYVLARSKEILLVPDTARILFQESEEELIAGLQSGSIDPNETICGSTSLQMAFGWPRGIQVLLEAGAKVGTSTLASFWGCPSPLEESDLEYNAFLQSTKLIVEAGCGLRVSTLQMHSASSELRLFFIDVLARRRKNVSKIARACLSQDMLQALNVREDAVLDLQAAKICEIAAARGKSIDWALWVEPTDANVYYTHNIRPEVMEDLLGAGFEDFDSPNSEGVTPLMKTYESFFSGWEAVERMAWFGSKGADQSCQLPSSCAQAAHLLTVQVIGFLLAALELQEPETVESRWSSLVGVISQHQIDLFPCQLIEDKCTCACSAQGCTIVSVAMRQVVRWSHWKQMARPSYWLKRLMACILDWTQRSSWAEMAILRSLTFDAVGLKHTCCIEIDGVHRASSRKDAHQMVGRDHQEISEIREENSYELDLFNQMIADLERKFYELELPFMEFVQECWYPQMLEHLRSLDAYSEAHDRATREIGVILHPVEEPDLDRTSLSLGRSTTIWDI
ncbi:Uncharacterized protein PECH_003814 [Penicillium ucsense]|uniref:Fungal N-terminal domain-containing protein n=1 Tax=Penicillium ucsense TaxID=2839758 RepID=A0A8J8VWN0_9EURO|nr:Uncharacterized protein PECM_002239 [Penicillium ucsense]KAF7729079.1 Uncharacterized protein PECH_003814 [Penicillium ucsense]